VVRVAQILSSNSNTRELKVEALEQNLKAMAMATCGCLHFVWSQVDTSFACHHEHVLQSSDPT
jgi:hypothetical protein